MFVYKNWKHLPGDGKRYLCRGWFLFGFVPLVVWQIDIDLAKKSG